jgi:predicted DNA-binding transcriptional regulator YafY
MPDNPVQNATLPQSRIRRIKALDLRLRSGRQPMQARIYRPARNAMTSGMAKTRKWVLEFAPASAREVDPLMGWTSSTDTQAQVKLRFDSKEAAVEYAEDHGIDAVVVEPKVRKANIRAGGYGENFATSRRSPWTH